MSPPLLTLKDVHVTFGSTSLLDGAEIAIEPGDKLCLVGRNGSGKSTLMKVAAGLIEPDKGERFMHPGARVAYLAQEADFTGYDTTLRYVEGGLGPQDDFHRARRLIEDLGLTGDEAPDSLSGGEARRVALARVLAPNPDVLLLDEPTNHLDLPAIEWLEGELKSFRGALVLISHDRRFLENLSRTTVWLDRGQARRLSAGFTGFEAWRDKVLEDEETERHKLDRRIVREDQWMHGGVTARRKRNVRRVRELRAMREERRNQRHAVGSVKLEAGEAGLSGRLVCEATGISKSFGGVKVVDNLTLRIMRGDRLGLVGPNGAGKTTLIKLLTGALQPDSGTIRLGENLAMIALDQRRDELKPEWTVADALTGGRGDQVVINGKARHVASYMKDFLFLPEQARSPCRVLSGGERARLLLARALAKPSNLLVLDEPTNDLDLETLDLLQEMLADYTGTVLLVSHDRDFLDRVVTSTLASAGDGKWIEYAGGYSDMLAQRKGAAPAKAETARNEARSQRPSTASDASRGETKRSETNPASTAEPATSTTKRKLSFKEKHALETLPAEIEKLSAEIATLDKTLDDANLFTRDPAAFHKATTRAAKAHEELSAAEERWLELEMLRQELEG